MSDHRPHPYQPRRCVICYRPWPCPKASEASAGSATSTGGDEPTALEMVTDLHRAVYGDTWARPESPRQVWEMLLGKVRGLASGWCGECERRAAREAPAGSATSTGENET